MAASLFFPAQPSPAQPSPAQPSPAQPSREHFPMLEQVTVLLADDDQVLAKAVAKALGARCDIVGVVTELDSLDGALVQFRPRVLLLDLMWREMSVLSRLVALHTRHPSTSVCMHTNYDAPRLVVDAFRKGAVGYLIKPAVLLEICEAVSEIAAGRRYLAPELRGAPGIMESLDGDSALIVPLSKPLDGDRGLGSRGGMAPVRSCLQSSRGRDHAAGTSGSYQG